ncbi:DUF1549 domain-containing protein [Prosthecobacter vanneervenii]|uniref:SLA1 homology domain-containing protein n=1 Tax=Prosthecobacter vanneervenii TaxID=48466 RepID=A0A7W8DLL5_9BACT|nr:DUF1549 domain-containing protein [Prosthecobacter vanneervenii]MBB5034292.1 hypothetical protein [Prosthecobacter vanneervenii]
MKQTKKLLSSLLVSALVASSAMAEVRTWTDTSGRQVKASFIGLDGENIVLQTEDGATHKFPLTKLSAEDQTLAKTMKPSDQPVMLANASVAQAAAAIDKLVANGLIRANPERAKMNPPKAPIKNFNPLANDEQFVRRVYLDIVGRIPNYAETMQFIQDSNPNKRAKLIDLLLDSPGYNSNTFNYFAEMLRVKDRLEQDNLRGVPYINWMQHQIEKNVTWDKMVFEMLTAKGKMWENGAAGYLLRDAGMPLDNLANTLAVFLGTDVACAQCHDHPFSDWTQHQFYEMASFFGATTTNMRAAQNRKEKGKGMASMNAMNTLMPKIEEMITSSGQDIKRLRNGIRNYMSANTYMVGEMDNNTMKLPHDYKYPDAKPNDPVEPKFITWSKNDKNLAAYKQKTKSAEDLRPAFAKWTTDPSNPRFAMAIANRMWKRAFGVAVAEPVTNIDDPKQAVNPELLVHLAEEMKRVKFDIKAFMRIIYNTHAYQAEATTEKIAMGEPYYFQGPLLRRMTAEQAWDSYMTLVLGEPDKYAKPLEDLYSRSIDLDLTNPKLDAQTVLIKYDAFRKMAEKERALQGGSLADAGGDMMMEGGSKTKGKAAAKPAAADMMENTSLTYNGMILRRASTLEQPAPNGHFLIDFGQSPRNLIDGSIKSGSVPQVLMMMNGKAQQMLTSSDSLIFRTMEKVKSPPEKVEALFVSILNRRPTLAEKDIAKRALSNGEDGYANMIWALINTREFIFIQ